MEEKDKHKPRVHRPLYMEVLDGGKDGREMSPPPQRELGMRFSSALSRRPEAALELLQDLEKILPTYHAPTQVIKAFQALMSQVDDGVLSIEASPEQRVRFAKLSQDMHRAQEELADMVFTFTENNVSRTTDPHSNAMERAGAANEIMQASMNARIAHGHLEAMRDYIQTVERTLSQYNQPVRGR